MSLSAAKRPDNDDSKILSLDILVAEDDPLNQRLMYLLLTHDGHRVELVSTGLEALEAVKGKKYDIIFMDLHMPVMDGLEASRQIRTWENGGMHTFIVALTASYVPENGQLLFEAGMDNYVSKPFAAKHIQRLLRYSSTARVQSDSSLNPMPAVESVQQVLDAQLGIQQVGGNPESYRELLTDFIYELPEKLQRVRKYCEAQNMQELSRAAHNLKGVAANLGVTQIFNLALRLEQQSNGSYTESLWGTIRDLELAAEILSGYTKDLPDKSDE